MANRSDKQAGAAGLFDGPLADSVKASAQQIWLAGMGAFAKAQEEGSKVFEALVQEGSQWQEKTQAAQAAAEERLGEMGGKLHAMAGEAAQKARHQAGASWDKLESMFETRTAKALQKLGMPTAQELASLSAQVEALTVQVARLSNQLQKAKQQSAKAAAASPHTRAKKAGAASAAPGKTAARKSASAGPGLAGKKKKAGDLN